MGKYFYILSYDKKYPIDCYPVNWLVEEDPNFVLKFTNCTVAKVIEYVEKQIRETYELNHDIDLQKKYLVDNIPLIKNKRELVLFIEAYTQSGNTLDMYDYRAGLISDYRRFLDFLCSYENHEAWSWGSVV